MLLIAAFAIYVIIVKRVRITRTFTLTGAKARTFGITLLVLCFPVLVVINLVLGAVLPDFVLQTPFLPKLLVVALFGAFAFGLAAYFRDEPEAPSADMAKETGTQGPVV